MIESFLFIYVIAFLKGFLSPILSLRLIFIRIAVFCSKILQGVVNISLVQI